MPNIFGLKLIPVLLASIAFYAIGYVWYDVLFKDLWMAAAGVTAADFEGVNPIWMIGGFVITLLQVIGIGLVLRWRGVSGAIPAVQTGLIIWALFALPFVHYAYIYTPTHDSTLLMIDASHMLVGWVVSAVILDVMK